MRRTVASLTAGLLIATTAFLLAAPASSTTTRASLAAYHVAPASRASLERAKRARACGGKLFTVRMAQRASRAVFSGTRTVTKHDWRALFYLARCQRNPAARKFVHGIYRADGAAHAQRIYWGDPNHWPQAKASWFNDGTTACGVNASTYQYGTASRDYPCGTQVDMERNGVRITVTVIDWGPAAYTGRMWDLTPGAADALGITGVGVGDVHYRVH